MMNKVYNLVYNSNKLPNNITLYYFSILIAILIIPLLIIGILFDLILKKNSPMYTKITSTMGYYFCGIDLYHIFNKNVLDNYISILLSVILSFLIIYFIFYICNVLIINSKNK